MEIVKECGTSILSPIVEDLVKSTGRQVGYIFRFKSIIEDLKEEAENLRLAQENMQHRVDGAIKDTDEIEKDVEKWLRDVTAVVADAEDLEKQTREKKTCLNGFCPNWIWRYQMARSAQKKISTMSKLKDGGKFDNVSRPTTLSGKNVLPQKDFMLFESTTYTFNLIIEALKDDKTNVVGLYGMGGVGKTTLAKAVVIKAKEENIFNEVVMVVVSNRDINKDENILSAKIRDIQESEVWDEFFEKMKALKVLSLGGRNLSLNSLQFLTNLVTLQLLYCKLRDISSLKKLSKLEILNLKGSKFVELPEELGELSKLRMLDITRCRQLKRIPANVIPRLSRLEELYIVSSSFEAWEVEGTSAERSNASLSELYQLNHLTILSLNINVQPCLSKDFVLPTKLLRYDIRVNDDDNEGASYPKSRLLKIRGIEATSLVAFKALYENVEYLKLVRIKGCCQNMVPSIDETGLNELKRLDLESFDELECIIDTTQQQDVASTAFSNLVDLSLDAVGLREICSGGRPPRGFLENLETLKIRDCDSMSSLFPSWVLIQRLRKLKKVTVWWCGELEDVFQLEGLCYAKENPFLLSSLESLDLFYLKNLRYIWKGPTQQVSLQSLTVVEVDECDQLRYLFTLSLARSLLQLEQFTVKDCGSLEHIVEIIKEEEENVGGGGGNDVMFPKLRKLQLGGGLPNFINFYSENPSLNYMQTAKEQLQGLNLWRHGLQNLEELKISGCRWVQVLFQLKSVEQELSLPSLKVLHLSNLEKLECLCMGPTHLLSLPNLNKIEVRGSDRLRHMFSPSLARNLLQLEELIIWDCEELEYIVSIKAEENVGGGGGNDVMLPKLRMLQLYKLPNFIDFCSENLSLNGRTTEKQLRGLSHGFPNLEELEINRCRVQVLFHLEGLKQELTFPSLKVLELRHLEEPECLCKGPTHLLSLPNLKILGVWGSDRLRHMFSPSLARNLLQLEELIIWHCEELEQIIVENHTEDDHVQLGLFPNLSSISVYGCGKLKTLFPAVTIARSGLQKLRTLNVEDSFQLEELFGHKDEADMTSCKAMVLPQLQELTLQQLASLVNFGPVGYHFIFPSLSRLLVTECPKITIRFSIDQNRSVHAEAEVLNNVDVDK
ncbi:hypothetical protein EZV62_008223 [Acer yangbiense]|uniref:Uncharacterized protein n=1 Tax=Acer yangbiense TaxID=1000413 RepID=A0A5C7ID34_9ROSI|nr:hypothetical protein EZV62_008223 [Acer yangbiense]